MVPLTDYPQAVNDLAEQIFQVNEEHGFWEEGVIPGDGLLIPKLLLIVSEVVEALDVFRNSYDDADIDPQSGMTPMQEADFAEEVSDAIIRALDLSAGYQLDIGDVTISKIETNRHRPHRHNKRF